MNVYISDKIKIYSFVRVKFNTAIIFKIVSFGKLAKSLVLNNSCSKCF